MCQSGRARRTEEIDTFEKLRDRLLLLLLVLLVLPTLLLLMAM